MSLDRITNPLRTRHWLGHMEPDYAYTLGMAGERFFREMKENARIMGTRCKRCGRVYLPPKIYCEECFEKLEEWIDVGTRGTIHTYTVVHLDEHGKKLEKSAVYALIKFKGTFGGLIHKIGEIEPKNVKIDAQIEAIFKPATEREGTINDIKYFRPIK